MAFALSVVVAVHRCSRCGQTGHNVRNCKQAPGRSWYAQRCSVCGEVGHNARNCARQKNNGQCRVCLGRGTLSCGKCRGTGVLPLSKPNSSTILHHANTPISGKIASPAPQSLKLNAQQREWARLARERTRFLRGAIENDDECFVGDNAVLGDNDASDLSHLVGGKSVDQVKKFHLFRRGTVADRPTEMSTKCSRCGGLGYLCCLSCSD